MTRVELIGAGRFDREPWSGVNEFELLGSRFNRGSRQATNLADEFDGPLLEIYFLSKGPWINYKNMFNLLYMLQTVVSQIRDRKREEVQKNQFATRTASLSGS